MGTLLHRLVTEESEHTRERTEIPLDVVVPFRQHRLRFIAP